MPKVNRNIIWTKTFINEAAFLGVKFACISPGSRNTPLTYASVTNKKIKSFSIIDERSSGFFALGLAKSTLTPVLLICTSGTAVAEFYPAIIEAYQSKAPLIICTADRPASLRNTGANQTINQHNIYKNHILWFIDAGLPKTTMNHLWHIKNIARTAYIESCIKNCGPVHINFPFDEPLDPTSATDEIYENQLDLAEKIFIPLNLSNHKAESLDRSFLHLIAKKLIKAKKGIIVVGFDEYTKNFYKECIKLSKRLGYPILADVTSNFRTLGLKDENILTDYDSYLRSEKFKQLHQPEFIIQFGRNFTSKALTQFVQASKCEKLLVNQFGDWGNQKNNFVSVIATSPELFCQEVLRSIGSDLSIMSEWMNIFIEAEKIASFFKAKVIDKAPFPNEIRIISEVIKTIPNNSNLMISNSLPIRDLDLVVPLIKKKIKIYHNRGASGIDGIISTALGIANSSKQRTFLVIGDVAFYHDMNSLHIAQKYSIPLTIILINNNGGRIFEMLPISKLSGQIRDYFITPHSLDVKKLTSVFNGNYFRIKSWSELINKLLQNHRGKFSVLEIFTDPTRSLTARKKYYENVVEAYHHKSK